MGNPSNPQPQRDTLQPDTVQSKNPSKQKMYLFGGAITLFVVVMLAVIFADNGENKNELSNTANSTTTATMIPTATPNPAQQEFQAVISKSATYDESNQYDKAAAELEKYVDSDAPTKEKLDAKANLAATYINNEEYDNAIKTYEELGQYEDYKLASIHGLAIAYRSKGDLQKSLDYYKEAVQYLESKGRTNETLYHTDKKVVSRLEQELQEQQ